MKITKTKNIWRSDTPEKPGLYNCLINKKDETVLQYKHCIYSNRYYWLYVDGSDVDPSTKIQWREGKTI